MNANNSFRRLPSIKITGHDNAATDCGAICSRISSLCSERAKTVIVAECYPGVEQDELKALFDHSISALSYTATTSRCRL